MVEVSNKRKASSEHSTRPDKKILMVSDDEWKWKEQSEDIHKHLLGV